MLVGTLMAAAYASGSVLVGPRTDTRKAYPLISGVGTATMSLACGDRYRIEGSWIEDKDGRSLWYRESKLRYHLSWANAPEEYVWVGGIIVPKGTGPKVRYTFDVLSPGIDIKWETAVGYAAQEGLEDTYAVPLSLSAPASKQRHLILMPATDKSGFANQITLHSSNSNVIRFWRSTASGDVEVPNDTTLNISGETRIRVQPLQKTNFEISISASGAPDDYSGAKVIDKVLAYVYKSVASI